MPTTCVTLTPKREAFARAYVELGCAAKAYRVAFDASRMAPETVRNRASETLARSDVKGMVDAIRGELAQRHNVTLDSLLTELENARLSAMASDKPQCAAAVQAILGKARLLGFLDSKRHDTAPDMAQAVSILINRLPG